MEIECHQLGLTNEDALDDFEGIVKKLLRLWGRGGPYVLVYRTRK